MIAPELIEAVALFTDGGVIARNPSDIGGTWAWCAVGTDGRRIASSSGVRPGFATNNLMEFIAAVRALEPLPAGWSGTLYSDSLITINRLFGGWALNNLPAVWITRASDAVRRLGTVRGVLLAGHPSERALLIGKDARSGSPVSRHNVWVDEECRRRGQRYLAMLEEEAVCDMTEATS